MRHEGESNGLRLPLGSLLRCPSCGSVLGTRLLEVEDEGESETLLLVDCPKDDFQATVTREDVTAVLTAAVRKRLQI